jgi:DNA polymerase-3 subunit alpha
MVKKNSGIEIDIDNLPLDDAKTYELFERGDTVGVFQFESEGMQSNLKELKPTVLEDLIMLNALYRPGPMDYIKNCIDRKHGREKIQYDLPDMEDILKETYGITVYQEQVMLLSQKLADFTGGEADTLRKAMGKKQLDTMQKLQGKFFEGCEKHNYDKKVCQKIWDDWVKFSEYAFNKSHATCYAYIAYQTAYLKANYPKEYMAALLNNEKDNRKIAVLTDDCIRQKINILGPDINESDVDFTATKSGHIRYGLATIKGVGSKELDNLVAEREENGNFKDLFDFAKRVNLKAFTKKNIELFAKVGAFDSFGIERAVFFCQGRTEGLNFADTLVNFSQQTQDISGETSLFGAADLEIPNPIIPTCEAFSQIYKLEAEKELLGTYVSGHPLDAYKLEKEYFAKTNIADFANNLEKFKDKSFNFIAIVSNARHLVAKNGNPWGSFTLQDYSGSIDMRLYTNNYLNFKQFLVDNITMVVNASVRRNFREEYELSINKLTLASEYMNSAVETITLSIPLQKIDKQLITNLDKIIKENKGKTKLRFKIADLEDNISVSLSPKHGLTAKTFALAIRDAYPDLQLSFTS